MGAVSIGAVSIDEWVNGWMEDNKSRIDENANDVKKKRNGDDEAERVVMYLQHRAPVEAAPRLFWGATEGSLWSSGKAKNGACVLVQ